MDTLYNNSHFCIGPIIGFGTFLLGVATLEGVLFRRDEHNVIKFRPDNFWSYMEAPFKKNKFGVTWGIIYGLPFSQRVKLWNLNWVIMVGCGLTGSIIYHLYFRN